MLAMRSWKNIEFKRSPFQRQNSWEILGKLYEVSGAETEDIERTAATAPARPSQHIWRSPQWLEQAIELGANQHDIQHISMLISDLEQKMHEAKFPTLGLVLQMLPIDILSPHVLIAIFRVTSPARSLIPGWKRSLALVEESLAARGLDTGRLLRGLA
jgi:hypothetical protein